MASKIYAGKNVPWATMKARIISYEFTIKAWIWIATICSHVSLCGNMTNIRVMRAHMIFGILDNISLNVGLFIISKICAYKS